MNSVPNKNREAFLRQMALTGHIVKVDTSEIKEAVKQLSGIAVNINQLAHRANETRSVYASDIVYMRDEILRLNSHVRAVLKLGQKMERLFKMA